MTKQSLQEIPLNKIVSNPSQPREHFDKKKIEELAESITSSGLINPVILRRWKKDEFQVVAGDRRVRAHKLAGLKTIQAFVKEYKDEGQMMIDSLIENIHREDLSILEKAKFLAKIKQKEKIETDVELAKKVGLSREVVREFLSILPIEKEIKQAGTPVSDYTTLSDIASIKDKKLRTELLKKGSKLEDNPSSFRHIVRTVLSSPDDVKKALLSDEINHEQAKRIAKLKSAPERARAIREHKTLSMVDKRIETNIENEIPAKEDKEFKKKLLQAGNWITSFRGSVTDSYKSLEKTIKILLVSTKFIPIMDDRQRETLEQQLDRFLEILNKATQLTEQIDGKIDKL